MKTTQKRSLSLFLILILFYNSVYATYVDLNLKSNNAELSKALTGTLLKGNDLSFIWSKLFMVERTTACRKYVLKKMIREMIYAEHFGNRAHKGKFWWVKDWGYGPSSYLFDFLDPVFKIDILASFNKLYEDTMHLYMTDTKDYKDPFAFKNFIDKDNEHMKGKIDLKSINKNYDPSIYGISANAVQIKTAIEKWGWFLDSSHADFAADFIHSYDLNGDGRLNARELILGAITHNKNAMGTQLCHNCFNLISKKIDAMFIFLDCSNRGFLTAEELWNSLPKLNRRDQRWNIFSFDNSENIRTNAINDFVIKNGRAREGAVTKEEFRTGLLYGYWDRHTTYRGILNDDSRSLKSLRWIDNDMIDTAAFNYVKEKTLAEMIAKAEAKQAQLDEMREKNGELRK